MEKINAEFEAFSNEANQQAEEGNKAAGTRARKAALELSKLFKDLERFWWRNLRSKKKL